MNGLAYLDSLNQSLETNTIFLEELSKEIITNEKFSEKTVEEFRKDITNILEALSKDLGQMHMLSVMASTSISYDLVMNLDFSSWTPELVNYCNNVAVRTINGCMLEPDSEKRLVLLTQSFEYMKTLSSKAFLSENVHPDDKARLFWSTANTAKLLKDRETYNHYMIKAKMVVKDPELLQQLKDSEMLVVQT